MAILGIDTTTKICEVSLKLNDRFVVRRIDEGFVHSDRLIPTINEILNENQLTVHDIAEIVVNVGPGSFTGIRVGVACARALAQTLDIKIRPVIAMDIIKFEAMKTGDFDVLIVLIDAMRGEAFAGIYDGNGGKLDEHRIYNVDDISCLLKSDYYKNKKIAAAGNGCANFYDIFNKFENIKIYNSDVVERHFCPLIDAAILGNVEAKNYWEIKPFYIRKTAAEEKKQIGL